jgi:ferritin-like metal-binding protein YciE
MKLGSLEDLLIDQLKDLYSAEKQILKALPKMAKTASHQELKAAFLQHAEETKGQIERLEQVFEHVGVAAKAKKCKAVEGLLEEGKEVMEADAEPAVLDAALIAAAQRIEHYEMAGYGCVRTYARQLGLDEAADLLQETLDEEGQTDEKLTQIAETVINVEAMEGAGEADEEE